MGLWILFALCFIAQCFSTPIFLKLSWPNRTIKSLTAKMVCATLFVAVGFLSAIISGNTSLYAKSMMLGLICGWVGDFFLHSDKNLYFAIGFISFLAGHIVYIKSYVRALDTFEDYTQFNVIEITALVALIILSIFLYKKYKLDFSTKFLQGTVFVYAVVLITMFIKATALGIEYMLSGAENGIIAVIVLSLGSLLFVMSDATIGILLFGGQKKNKPLKIFNIVTYFAGQMLLATSILFVNI